LKVDRTGFILLDTESLPCSGLLKRDPISSLEKHNLRAIKTHHLFCRDTSIILVSADEVTSSTEFITSPDIHGKVTIALSTMTMTYRAVLFHGTSAALECSREAKVPELAPNLADMFLVAKLKCSFRNACQQDLAPI
jgi:hypothetical protein